VRSTSAVLSIFRWEKCPVHEGLDRPIGTAEDPANPVGELVSTEQLLGLNYLTFAMKPLWLDRIEPWALGGQSRHGTIRTPWPLALTLRLWAMIHPLTSWLLCQLALSQR
jgi:hypothetical protein